MKNLILTFKLLKKTFEEWTPQLAAIISTVSIMMSMDGLCPKDVNKEVIDTEQILSDRQEMVLKVDLQRRTEKMMSRWIYKRN